jgi:CheY-like chemotaxis protein
VTPGNGEKIVVVEDDPLVRRFTVEALTEVGYEVVEAADGPAGLAVLEAHADARLLFTDVVLIGPMNGRKLADAALQLRPELKVVFTTGYTRNAIIHHGRLDPGVELLGKPFTARELTEKIRAVLHR